MIMNNRKKNCEIIEWRNNEIETMSVKNINIMKIGNRMSKKVLKKRGNEFEKKKNVGKLILFIFLFYLVDKGNF